MKYVILILAALISLVDMKSSHNLLSDSQYVWARSGLNLRTGPGVHYNLIDNLAFGDSVIIMETTNLSYNIKAIEENPEAVSEGASAIGAYILYGNWVKVATHSGEMGYVLDTYLIDICPILEDESIGIKELSRDTISLYDGAISFETVIEIVFSDGITGEDYSSSACGALYLNLPNHLSIQEVFIMLEDSSTEDGVVIKRNWKNHVVLINDLCEIEIRKDKNGIRYESVCCC